MTSRIRPLSPQLATLRGFPWRHLSRVGEGASAIVFRAERADGTVAALKVARDDAGWIGREAALLGTVGRRWGPSLLDAGVIPAGADPDLSGRRFLSTTWTEGASLADVVAAERDRASLVAIVAHGVARGLDELHALRVRHGDVKLANVIVGPNTPSRDRADERGATLIDMGLAVDFDAQTPFGATPRYLAPEVKAGQRPTLAADLHALGVVLAEILLPELVEDDDVAASLPRAYGLGEVGAWIEALASPSPGARPSAAWIADRAARMLALEPDEEEIISARRARVRRSYLAVRADDIRAGRRLSPAITEPARTWLVEAEAIASKLSANEDGQTHSEIQALDAFGASRWLVTLIGPSAAAFPTPPAPEGELAEKFLALSANAPPEAWTLDDLQATSSREPPTPLPRDESERWVAMTRELVRPRPDPSLLAAAEDDVLGGRAPRSLGIDLAHALVRRGESGRAFAVLSSKSDESAESLLVLAEIARRRGDVSRAESVARNVVGTASSSLADDARGLLGRLAWDKGDFDRADSELGDARGAVAAEVRALVAYGRADYEKGRRLILDAKQAARDDLSFARLDAVRAMIDHAEGRAAESLVAFTAAAERAARGGAVIEEATYLTGLAAAAVDAGAVGSGLSAASRAALLWERLDRPALSARAFLSRASAFSLVGASHEAERAASLAMKHARVSGDARALAFARWAIAETRAPSDARARDEVLQADRELWNASSGLLDEDGVRSAARLLVWAGAKDSDGNDVDVEALDARAETLSPSARWEWWGARAATTEAGSRVLSEIATLLGVPAPIASRGPALAAAVALASRQGDGDLARRIEASRREAADTLRQGTPVEYGASLAQVGWVNGSAVAEATATAPPLGAAQVEQLDAIVRSLSSRDRLRTLIEQVLDAMILWTGVERGLLLLRAPDGRLVPRAARNLARHDLHGEQLTLSMGLAKRAMDEGQTVCATDAYAQIGDLHASVHALRLRSVLAVPLVARGDTLGVVYLDDRVRRGAFGAAELSWVRLVASQAALAIADARDQALLRRAVRRAERANQKLATELGVREAELASARAEIADDTRFRYDEIQGRSEPMRAMLKLVDRVTTAEVPVLLVGESGTGKELVARAIHTNGPRGRRPFVSENCAAVPENLLESTLFGHVRGAFTGASSTRAGLFDVADTGTLFLDEIGEMSLAMQTKLLRVLQDGEVRPVGGERSRRVDVRIMGATHRDLEAMVKAGTFREDLFYRLNVVAIKIPPLRERVADVPLLVRHFLDKHEPQKRVKVTRAAMDRIAAFPWPGNVRQLENEVRRALVMADDQIDVADLSDEVARGGPAATRDAKLGLRARLDALEADLVRDALSRTKGNQTRAAEVLGISRFGLQKMMRRLGILST